MTNDNQFVLVTGGSGGLGVAIGLELLKIGLIPILTYNNNLHRIQKISNLYENSICVQVNFESENSTLNLISKLSELTNKKGSIVGAVLCSSPAPKIKPFSQIGSESIEKHIRVNVISNYILINGLINNHFKVLKKGFIYGILTSAIGKTDSDEIFTPGMASYTVGKSALNALLKACNAEYRWLKVETFNPGFIQTDMLQVFDSRYVELLISKNQVLTPEFVAMGVIRKIINV